MVRIFFLLALPVCCSLQEHPQWADINNARQTITQMLTGIGDRNLPMIRRYTTPDFLILEDGHLYNLDSISKDIARTRRFAAYKRVNHIYFATTRINGNAAWLAFTDIADVTKNGKTTTESFLESAFLIKLKGAWKVYMIHSTTIASYVK